MGMDQITGGSNDQSVSFNYNESNPEIRAVVLRMRRSCRRLMVVSKRCTKSRRWGTSCERADIR
jgi:hypothetical protein